MSSSLEFPIKRGEGRIVFLMVGFAFLSVAFAILIRVWSDAAFLAEFEVSWLPLFYIASAVVFVPATFLYAGLHRRYGSATLNTALLGAFTAGVLACCQASGTRWGVFAAVLGLAVVSPLVNVICWNTILDRMDSRRSKRLIPMIGGFATLGAIGAGGAASALIEAQGADALLWLTSGLLVVMIPLPRAMSTGHRRRKATDRDEGTLREGIASLGRNRLLALVASGTFLMALTTNIIDYEFKAHLQASLDRDAMAVFLARFHAIANIAILVVQFVVVTPVLKRFGVGLAFALHPAVVLLGGLGCMVHPTLAAAVALRFADTLLKFTFHTDTNNLLLTPVPQEARNQVKIFLKGLVYPLGGFVAGIVLPVAGWLGGGDPGGGAGLMVALLALGWLALGFSARRRYLHQIAENLSIEVRPGRTYTATPKGRLTIELQRDVHRLRRLRRQGHQAGSRGAHKAEIGAALQSMFKTLGRLVGDQAAVAAAAERYVNGRGRERADAVELLESFLHSHHLPDAGDLLDKLTQESGIFPTFKSDETG